MKKYLLILLFSLSVKLFAQDIITKKNGEEIQSKVYEISTTEVKYKPFTNLNGPLYTLLKSEILFIKYENGTKEIFNQDPTPLNTSASEGICDQAKLDANSNYRGENTGAFWTGFTACALSPLFAAIPAIACSSTQPSEVNLNIPQIDNANNSKYKKCYAEEAHKMKKKKVWTGFAIGSSIWLLLVFIAY